MVEYNIVYFIAFKVYMQIVYIKLSRLLRMASNKEIMSLFFEPNVCM